MSFRFRTANGLIAADLVLIASAVTIAEARTFTTMDTADPSVPVQAGVGTTTHGFRRLPSLLAQSSVELFPVV